MILTKCSIVLTYRNFKCTENTIDYIVIDFTEHKVGLKIYRIQGRLKQVKRELKMNYIKLISLLAIAHCPILFAQIEDDIDELTDLYDDEELIRIATGTAKPIRFAPSVASVITVEDIQRSGARTLAEVLETVPGLSLIHI